GGASIAVVNDETALLANPAGLGKLRDSYGTLIDPELDGGFNMKRMYDTKAFTNPFDLEQVRDTTDYTRDSYFHAKGQVFPSFVVRNFGIGIHASRTMDAQMNTDGTEMTTFYQDDVALHMGLNLRFFDGRIKIGVVGKAISRIEVDKVLPVSGSFGLSENASEGFGVGSDGGIILTAPVVLLPTISAVVRDIGGTPFTAGSGLRMQTTTRPVTVEQDIDVAIAMFPIHSNRSRSAFSFEYQKIKAAGLAEDKQRFYHFGYEYNYSDLLFFRAGMNQRYWTAGFELASEHTQFQIASYGEDVGVDGSPVEDRRYVFKFAFRF
ncbi:MAG: hypothetical protein ACXWC9_05340, partial [Pseudobdellovibrionaceae bacterium]